jgi:hypothetical protein
MEKGMVELQALPFYAIYQNNKTTKLSLAVIFIVIENSSR